MNYCVKVAIAEGMALRRVMEVCADLGFARVVFEDDSQIIAKAANSDEDPNTDYGILIHDVRPMLLERASWQVDFVHHEADLVAHQLSKVALVGESEQIWIEDGPINADYVYCFD